MMGKSIGALVLIAAWAVTAMSAQAFWHGNSYAGVTYYIAPSGGGGSDSNNGLTSGAPRLTPSQSGLNCGDTISAAAGAYSSANFTSGKWATVAGCPSGGSVY